MEKYVYWGAGILVLLGLINSCNSSNRYKEVSTLHPYTYLREPSVGYCDCPYDLDQRGYKCGNRSAYARTGGAEPVCYVRDVRGY